MTPADGLAFLTSAISLIGPSLANAAKKSRTGGAYSMAKCSWDNGTVVCAVAISMRLVATILSRIVGMKGLIQKGFNRFAITSENFTEFNSR